MAVKLCWFQISVSKIGYYHGLAYQLIQVKYFRSKIFKRFLGGWFRRTISRIFRSPISSHHQVFKLVQVFFPCKNQNNFFNYGTWVKYQTMPGFFQSLATIRVFFKVMGFEVTTFLWFAHKTKRIRRMERHRHAQGQSKLCQLELLHVGFWIFV